MSTKEKSARLILNTALFYPNPTGATITTQGVMDLTQGYADPSRLNCTWTNLDWIQILGDMYDEYSSFLFTVESNISHSAVGTSFSNYVIVNAVGLDWQNQTYDALTKTTSNSCIIYNGGISGTQIHQQDGFLFRKPANRYGNLTLTVTNSYGTQVPVNANYTQPLQYVYVIKIFGHTKDDHFHA